MLCFRCEHRAKYLTAKSKGEVYCPRPRMECGDINTSKYICYMFKPCFPIITKPSNSNDKRPRFAGAMLSSREEVVRVMEREEIELTAIYDKNNEVALGWKVKE